MGNFRTTAILGIAAGLLGAACVLAEVLRTRTTLEGTVVLTSFPIAEAVKIRVEYPGKGRPTVVATRTREGWRLEEPYACDADAQTVERIAGYLGDLKGVSRWREDDPEIALLAKETTVVEAELADGKKVRASLGGLTGSGFRGYARVSSKKGIWEVSKALWDATDRDTVEFRDIRILTVDSFDVEGFELARGALIHRVEKQGEDWVLRSPFEDQVDDYEFFDFLTQIEKLRAIGFASETSAPETLRRFGLETPEAVVTVRGKGRTSAVSLGKTAGPAGEEWFARRHDRPYVARVKPEIARLAAVDDPQRFRGRSLLPDPQRWELEEFSVQGSSEGKPVSFRAKRETFRWMITEPHVRAVDAVDKGPWSTLLQELTGLKAEKFVDESPSAADLEGKYGLSPAALRIEVKLREAGAGRPREGEAGRERRQSRTILLGRSVPEEGICFAKAEGGKGNVVAVVDRFKTEVLGRGYVRFIPRDLVKFDVEDVRWAEFEHEGKAVRVERQGERWVVVKPAGAGTVDEFTMGAALGEELKLAAQFVQEAGNPAELPAEFGLSPPQAVLKLALKIRQEETRVREVELHFGTFKTNQSFYARYAAAEGFENRNLVFVLGRTPFDKWLEIWKEKKGR